MSSSVVIFGGTSEGRKIAQHISKYGHSATLCVATEYGSCILPEMPGITINEGKLDAEAITGLIDSDTIVIDATHPYASAATANIRSACTAKQSRYYRLFRPEILSGDLQSFETYDNVVNYLNTTHGNILLTTGSRALSDFTKVKDFENRIYPRILPSADSLKSCLSLGYKTSNIICMQGPFSEQMNTATINSFKIKYLVTKDSGIPGGTIEKINAAINTGIEALVVGRPVEEKGHKFSEIIDIINRNFDISPMNDRNLRFPLFVEIFSKNIAVFGGGAIAQRRVTTLLKFGAKVLIVSPKLTPQLAKLAKSSQITHKNRKYHSSDLDGVVLALAATNDREANHKIYLDATAKNIPISVADCREECSFFFPAIAMGEGIVAGIVSDGDDHKLTVQTAAKIRDLLGSL